MHPSQKFEFDLPCPGCSQQRTEGGQNRAAIDFLLLKHNYGCETFKGMCCFNLDETSGLVERDIHHLKELAQNIGHEQSFLDFSWLFSWLPDLHWLKVLMTTIVTICVLGVLLCCLCHCIPPCLSYLKTCIPTSKPELRGRQAAIMMTQMDHGYQVYSDTQLEDTL
uniref:Uncharacterized protein n=1 Tax=Micrurus spixii TaxID=129469 RepID=A0A2D4MH41_9SAUR